MREDGISCHRAKPVVRVMAKRVVLTLVPHCATVVGACAMEQIAAGLGD